MYKFSFNNLPKSNSEKKEVYYHNHNTILQ